MNRHAQSRQFNLCIGSDARLLTFGSKSYLLGIALILALFIPYSSAFAQTTLAPASLSFGNQPVGAASIAKTATLRNTQTVALTINNIAISGANAGDFSFESTCPISPSTLASRLSCTITMTLTASALGSRTATLTVIDSALNSPQSVALSGTGIAPVSIAPASVTFPSAVLGSTSAARMVTLSNHLTTALAVSSVATSANFAVASNTCGSSVGAGLKCTVGVTFSPTVLGLEQGTLTIAYGAFGSPTVIALNGTGIDTGLTSITVAPTGASIAAGSTLQFAATGHFRNGSTENLTSSVTWNSSATGIATIAPGGLATGASAGTATISAALGTISGSTTLSVTSSTFTIGGTISGLSGTGLVLQNNGGNNLPINANGSFTFSTQVVSGSAYNVTLLTQPSNPAQTCVATNASGTATANVTNVTVSCAFTALTATMTSFRASHTATLLLDGTVLITGGVGSAGTVLNTAELYDPITQTFTALSATMKSVRSGHTATLLPSGQVLFTGGSTSSNGSGNLSTAELYDPSAQTFTALTATMTSPRAAQTATLLPDGKVLITGGFNDSVTALNTAELYDPTAQTFTALTPRMTSTRAGHTATLLDNGTVLLTGGFNNSNSNLNTAELYSQTFNTFTAVSATMTSTRDQHTATMLPNGTVLLTGGSTSAHDNPALNTVEVYDPVADTFTALADTLTVAREFHTATLLPSNVVLFTGGVSNPFPTALDSAEVFDPSEAQ